MYRIKQVPYAKSESLILPLLISPLFLHIGLISCSVSTSTTTYHDAYNVGIVITDKASIYSLPDENAELVDTADLGKVFFVHTIRPDSAHTIHDQWWEGGEYEWCRIILEDGSLGWIYKDDFRLRHIEMINCRGKKDTIFWYDTLPGGDVISPVTKDDKFVVVKYFAIKDTADSEEYYKVKQWKYYVERQGKMGWVKASDVTVSHELVLLSAGNHLGKWVQDIWWGKYNDIDAAEKIFELLLEEYPNKQVLDREYEYGGRINTGVAALEHLSEIHVKKNDYESAIERLEEIIEQYPNTISGIGRASGVAKNKIAEVYWKHMREPYKAVSKYQEVIEEHPGEEISGFEWNSTLDIEAINTFNKIKDAFNLDDGYMLKQFQMAIDNSTFPPVEVISYIERAKILRKQKRSEEAIKELTTAIYKNPSATMTFFKTLLHYSASALDLLCKIYLEDIRDPEQARTICQEIYEEKKDESLARVAMYLKAEILDQSTGTRQQVIDEYTIFNEFFHGSWGVASLFRNWYDEISPFAVNKRLDQINSFKPKTGVIILENIPLCAAPYYGADTISNLRAGEKITAQYPLFRTNRIIGTKEVWYKIITRDDTIGWVQEDQFDFTLHPLILASDASDKRAWATYGANRGHTRTIAGTPIKNPQLRNFFTDIKANEPIYYDINADGILDVITTGIIDRLQEYERGRIAAFDGATQETLWTLASDENFDNAAPSIDKETLYCCSRGGVVYAAEISDGTIRWTCPVGQVVLTSPVVYDTCVFVASVNGYVHAIHRDKGILLWKLQVGHTIYSTPVIKDHKLYCGLYGRNAYFVCVDLNSQKTLWKYETDWMQISSSPAIVDDILLCGANDHHLYALDIASGSLKWRYKTHNPITSSPAATDSIVCVTSSDRYVYGIEINTGKLLWKFKADEQFRASPCIIGDVLYAGSYDGFLYALSVPNGQLLWKYEIGAPIENAISGVGALISVSTSTNNLYFIGEK